MNLSHKLFEEFCFQDLAIQMLSSSIKKNHIAPAYLFTGPQGVGQKEIALRFLEGIVIMGSKNLNREKIRKRIESGNHPDLYKIEPTYSIKGKLINQSIYESENFNSHAIAQIRLEQIKNLKYFLNQKPIESKLSMVLLENVEELNESAANALLKTLEEPINGLLILISSRPEQLLVTIKSRCQIIPFKPLSNTLLQKNLNQDTLSQTFAAYKKELLVLSNGSPDLLEKILSSLEEIPDNIWSHLENLPTEPLAALELAKKITDNISPDKQLFLIDWMQQYYWEKEMEVKKVKRLEKLKMQLKSYINQRIAWEIALIDISMQ